MHNKALFVTLICSTCRISLTHGDFSWTSVFSLGSTLMVIIKVAIRSLLKCLNYLQGFYGFGFSMKRRYQCIFFFFTVPMSLPPPLTPQNWAWKFPLEPRLSKLTKCLAISVWWCNLGKSTRYMEWAFTPNRKGFNKTLTPGQLTPYWPPIKSTRKRGW